MQEEVCINPGHDLYEKLSGFAEVASILCIHSSCMRNIHPLVMLPVGVLPRRSVAVNESHQKISEALVMMLELTQLIIL